MGPEEQDSLPPGDSQSGEQQVADAQRDPDMPESGMKRRAEGGAAAGFWRPARTHVGNVKCCSCLCDLASSFDIWVSEKARGVPEPASGGPPERTWETYNLDSILVVLCSGWDYWFWATRVGPRKPPRMHLGNVQFVLDSDGFRTPNRISGSGRPGWVLGGRPERTWETHNLGSIRIVFCSGWDF